MASEIESVSKSWQTGTIVKQYTSSTFKTISALLMGFPLVYIVVAGTALNVPISGCARLMLSPMYYLVTGVAVLAGYGFWEMRRWSWYVFWIAQGLIAYETAIIASEYAESHHRLFIFIMSLFVQALVGFRMSEEILVPYFFPKVQWWENNSKYKLAVPVKLHTSQGEEFFAEILDLALVGCFIKSRTLFREGDKIDLEFQIFGQNVRVEGTVVWEAMSTVTHPMGIGVLFEFVPKEQRKILRAICARLRRIAAHYRKYRYWMEPIEFEKILLELQTLPLERPKLSVIGRQKTSDGHGAKKTVGGSH